MSQMVFIIQNALTSRLFNDAIKLKTMDQFTLQLKKLQ